MTAIPQLEVVRLPVADLTIGEDFRLDDDAAALLEMADSIRQLGVLQPLLVRPRGAGFEVIAGRRRLAAARHVGLEVVPCTVHDVDDDEAADRALAENLHRRDLSPVEVGLAYARLRSRGLNQREIAERVGRSPAQVGFLLALLELPAEIRDKVHRREMSYMTALYPKGTGRRQGGPDRPRKTKAGLSDESSAIVSHWRRRHDRLLAGLQAIVRSHPRDVGDCLGMVERLVKLDAKPFVEDPPVRDWRGTFGRSKQRA